MDQPACQLKKPAEQLKPIPMGFGGSTSGRAWTIEQPTRWCRQHHPFLSADQVEDQLSNWNSQSNGMDVVVTGQPRPILRQHHAPCPGVHACMWSTSHSNGAVVTVLVVVIVTASCNSSGARPNLPKGCEDIRQPFCSFWQHHAFFSKDHPVIWSFASASHLKDGCRILTARETTAKSAVTAPMTIRQKSNAIAQGRSLQ
mmetsp:Transcript_13348/g.47132  ORF Transcript_13348/g.47132 Transcript_13348/m.47132 type:complete len:200 (+) Transcript_13348:3324-3923(+)